MNPLKFNTDKGYPAMNRQQAMYWFQWLFPVALLVGFLFSEPVLGKEVSWDVARQVAQSKMGHHVALYGHWNQVTDPVIESEQLIQSNDVPVAYNFNIRPSGHILVALDDALSPVLLYSTTSVFDPQREQSPKSIESWILSELSLNMDRLRDNPERIKSNTRSLAGQGMVSRIATAWDFYQSPDESKTAVRALGNTSQAATLNFTATVGPVLDTAWGQAAPYNLYAPEDGCAGGENTLTGCVATAWAQLMRYWQWPLQGEGSHTYDWNGQDLSANFGETQYDWSNMPATLDGSSIAEQEATALLIHHAGIAAEMNFGCDGSGSSVFAHDVLDLYFGYRTSMTLHSRSYYQDGAWFSLFQNELDASPPRPVLLSILLVDDSGGHKVVVDGYQNSPTDMVHINFGWTGIYDGYYDITTSFETAPYTWKANEQYIVTGIEPANEPPDITIDTDSVVDEGSLVQLNGDAVDPEGEGISSYLWSQTSGPSVVLLNAGTANATFTAPEVHQVTQLVFSLNSEDVRQATATQTCTILVSNTNESTPPASDPETDPISNVLSGSSGSSGGCFLNSIRF
jgi:hypothetical protein